MNFTTKNLLTRMGLAAFTAMATVGSAMAQDAAPPADAAAPAAEAAAPAAEAAAAAAAPVLAAGDTAWMMVSAVLVLMMLMPGLALFYGGMVRKKNVLSILMQCFAIGSVLSIVYVIAGYSLSFTDGNAWVGDTSKMMLAGVTKDSLSGTIPETVFIFFQMTFFIITPALIVGAFADRMKFSAVLIFVTIWSLVVYAPICHMVWQANGYLFKAGAMDFAGGTVVHINAGIAGLVAAYVLGKRKGYGTENMAPHNLAFTMIGASLLWVGWFGFNAGSALAASGLAGMAMLNTHLATAAAASSWMIMEWIIRGKPSVLGALSGAIAGLVAITPACGWVDPTGALIIGLLSGAICLWGVTGLKKLLGADDALDCFGVHGVGGIVGALLTGVFAAEAVGGKAGLLYGGGWAIMQPQVEGVLISLVWSGVATFIILKVLDLIMGIRVSEEVEREGLDLALHGEAQHG